MKESLEANYFLKVFSSDVAFGPQLDRLLPRTYLITVNLIARVAIVPWLPASPWPPPYPMDWDHWRDRDEAARWVFATEGVTVAPTEEREVRIQTVSYKEYPETEHTVFWVPRADYEALLADVERAYDTPALSKLRLDELASCPLAEFLRHQLPRASLSPVERKILCLDPPSAPSS